MSTLNDIEEKARRYADARALVAARMEVLQAKIDEAERAAMPAIKQAARAAVEAHSELRAAIKGGSDLFERPKTQIIAGIKVGFTKQRGKVVIEDEAFTIDRIKKRLPRDQVELLIRTTEQVHKPSVYDLEARDLKRLGITITDDTDAVVVKPIDDALSKLVDSFMATIESAAGEDEAAA